VEGGSRPRSGERSERSIGVLGMSTEQRGETCSRSSLLGVLTEEMASAQVAHACRVRPRVDDSGFPRPRSAGSRTCRWSDGCTREAPSRRWRGPYESRRPPDSAPRGRRAPSVRRRSRGTASRVCGARASSELASFGLGGLYVRFNSAAAAALHLRRGSDRLGHVPATRSIFSLRRGWARR
jgi:hypothetical protein